MSKQRFRFSRWISGFVLCVAVGIAVYFHFVQPPFAAIPSSSMVPTLRVGDLVRIGSISPANVRVGDIVVVKIPSTIQNFYHYPASITHRVVSISRTQNDELDFQTKGDANQEKDPFIVSGSEVQGKVVGILPRGGYPILFMQSKQGHIFLLSVAVIYVLYQLYSFWEKSRKRVRRTVSDVFFGDLVERVESMEMRHQMSTEKIDEALKSLSSAIENYAFHLQSHTSAVEDLAESAGLIQQVTSKQLEIMELTDQVLHRELGTTAGRMGVSARVVVPSDPDKVQPSIEDNGAHRAAIGFLYNHRSGTVDEHAEAPPDDPVEAEIQRLRKISQKYRDLL